MYSPWILSSLVAWIGALIASSHPYECKNITLPVDVSVQVTELNIQAPATQAELTGLVTRITSMTSNISGQVIGGKTELSASYDIWSQLCVPVSFPPNGTLEFAIHGISFDHSYWSFGGKGSKYNYVEAAIKAGHAIFTYDRLGTGKSSKPDGIKEVQTSTEVAIAASLVQHLRRGIFGHSFGKVIGIGHSYGSIQIHGLATTYGSLVDAVVHTGLTVFPGHFPATLAGFGEQIAAKQDPFRFGTLSNAYMVTGGIYNNQLAFFHYPEFEYESLEIVERNKGTLTLGELLTQGEPLMIPAINFTGPVLALTGDKDYIFCGGNCYQPFGGFTNLLAPMKMLYPSTSNFSTYLVADTGHAVNLHFSAPEVFDIIQEWIGE